MQEGNGKHSIPRAVPVVDMHCHILPGIDDGARTWEDSLAMARAAVAAGITHLVATPHYMEGTYPNPRTKVLALVGELRERLAGAGIPLNVFPGTEAYISPDLPERVKAGEVTTVNDGGRYLLVELPYVGMPPWAEDVLFQLQVQGVTPIIAHPERNRNLQRDPGLLFRWVERGALAQVDAGSLEGSYRESARQAADVMLEHRLVQLAGSDAHTLRQVDRFAAVARAARRTSSLVADCCLAGEPVPAPDPVLPRTGGGPGWRRALGWLGPHTRGDRGCTYPS